MTAPDGSLVQGDRLSVSPGLTSLLDQAQVPRRVLLVDRRSLWISFLAVMLAVLVAQPGPVPRAAYLLCDEPLFLRHDQL